MATDKQEFPYAVLDVETTMIRDGEYPKTLFWGYADETGYYKFQTTRKLLAFLRSHPVHIILHHSNFDVLQLLLDGANIQILRSHNARLIRCKLGKQILLNSYSVFPLSLASIFDCFGFKKTSLDDLEKRNYEDCVNGLDCFLRLDGIFSRLVAVSPLARGTIAGTSFQAAQLCAGSKMPEDKRFLEAYRGGRVEVFNTSKHECDKYDINSSYPYSILQCEPREELLCVQVRTKDFYCPLFDASQDEMLLFPNGTFQSWVYRSTLDRYILPHCAATKIRIISAESIDMSWLCSLKPLIEKLYRLKNESKTRGEKAIETACKLLLNSMYGRIGLKGDCERARILDYFPDGDECTIYKLGKKRYLCFDSVFRESKANFPFAAFITDNARGRLYRGMVGASAYYGDTDSVIAPQAKKYFDKHEPQGLECGQWKYEGREMFKANNVKDYFWGEEEVRKGGDGFIQWTLKTLGSGKTPHQITRNRVSELRKRTEQDNGVTVPLVVKH